jgi:hypothetical protein
MEPQIDDTSLELLVMLAKLNLALVEKLEVFQIVLPPEFESALLMSKTGATIAVNSYGPILEKRKSERN